MTRIDLRMRWLAIMALASCSANAGVLTDYGYIFPLHTDAKSDIYRIVLTPDVYAHSLSSANLQDLMVVNRWGQPVPFARIPSETPHDVPYKMKLRLRPVTVSEPGKPAVREWLIDAGQTIELDSITLLPPAGVDLMPLSFAIDGSDDQKSWMLLSRSADTDIFLGWRKVDERKLDVQNPLPARYFRLRLLKGALTWNDGASMDAIIFGHYPDTHRIAKLAWLPLQASSVKRDNSAVTYIYPLPIAIHISAVRMPSTSFGSTTRLDLTDDNGYHINGSISNINPSPLVMFRQAGDGDVDQVLRFSPDLVEWSVRMTALHVRASYDDRDGPPRAPALQVAWEPASFVFLADGPGPYRLLSGSRAAKHEDVPDNTALQRLRSLQQMHDSPPLATLGEVGEISGQAALGEAPAVPNDWTRPLLWAALVAGALLVAGIVLTSSRKQVKGR